MTYTINVTPGCAGWTKAELISRPVFVQRPRMVTARHDDGNIFPIEIDFAEVTSG